MVRFFYVKRTKNVKLLSGGRGPHGPDLPSSCRQKFQFHDKYIMIPVSVLA